VTPRAGRPSLRLAAALTAALLATPVFARAQNDPNAPVEPEVIRIDPNAAPVPAPPPAGGAAVPAAIGPGVNAREVLINQFWFKHQTLTQRGATREASALVDQAVAFMEREGLRASPEVGAAFLAGARRARRDGEMESALDQVRLSLRFDPGRADARFTLAGLLVRQGDLAGGLRAFRDGIVSLLQDPELLFYLSGAVLVVVYLGVVGGLALALLLIGLKARPAFVHDLQERLTGRMSPAAAALLGGAILALPLVLPVPLAWAPAFWGALLFAWIDRSERLVIACALAGLVLAGVFGAAVAWHADTTTDPEARALLQAARAGPDLRHEAALLRAAEEHPGDPIYPFLLGSAYRVGGRLDEATTMYRKVLAIDPDNARAMVNLGNLHALRQEFSLAQALYKKAGEVDPTLMLAAYDSHLAYLETFNMEAADEALRNARHLDEVQVNRLLGTGTSAANAARRAPQDTRWPQRDIVARALRLRLAGGPGAFLRAGVTNATGLAAAAGLLAALFVPGLLLAPRGPRALRCQRCGRAYCRRCQMTTKHAGHCAQCVHLFLLRDGVAPSVRDQKLSEVVRYRRRVFLETRLASLLLPGCGQVMGGRAVLGATLLAGWGVVWSGLLLRGRFLAPPGAIEAAAIGPGTLLLAALGAGVWLMANLSRQEAAEG
jgi:tetratricopeptide (TPR) repeat protein